MKSFPSELALALSIVVAYTTLNAIAPGTAAAAVRTVALTGQQIPGLPNGVMFGSFNVGVHGGNTVGGELNDAGQTAFRSTLNGAGVDATNDLAIWSEGGGSLGLVARTGDQAPGMTSGVLYGSVSMARLNDAGQTAFIATLTGSGVDPSNDQSVWSDRSGSLALVSREGDQAPGTPAGVRFGSIDSPWPLVLNNAGQTAFKRSLSGTGVDSTNNVGIWSEGSGGLALVARSGDQAPGTPGGVNFTGFSTANMNLNDAGQTAFQASLTGVNNRGIFAGDSGSLRTVALRGEHAPGTPPTNQYFVGFSTSTDLNNAGQVSFAGNIFNLTGVWSEGSGSLALVALQGDPAPGTPAGMNFGAFNFHDPVLNDAGQIAFIESGAQGNGLWLGSSGNLELVARTGDQAPGMPPGVHFGSFRNSLVLNSAGQIALLANVTNGVGLWATDRDGVLQYIMCTGDELEVAPGDFRTIQDFGFFGETGNGDGRASGFNNLGQIAFSASFTDGRSGVFVSNAVAQLPGDFNHDSTVDAADYVMWRKTGGSPDDYNIWRNNFGEPSGGGSSAGGSATVPEPATLAMLSVAAAGVCSRRRRGRTESPENSSTRETGQQPTVFEIFLVRPKRRKVNVNC
jgi:hypothetical protein